MVETQSVETLFRCPEVSSKCKGRLQTVFRTIVAEMCEEFESCHDQKRGTPVVSRTMEFLRSCQVVIKTNIPLDNDVLAHRSIYCKEFGERIEKLSQQDQIEQIFYLMFRIPQPQLRSDSIS